MNPLRYSVLIPLRDEEGSVKTLISELERTMDSLAEPWELICIDDGSQDKTRQLLEECIRHKPFLRLIRLAAPSGQSAALAAGFSKAKGEWMITLDGDGQNDPADIPKLVAAAEGYDLVCSYRVNRRDHWTRRLIAQVANAIRSRFCGDGVQDSGCSLKIFRTTCLQNIPWYDGMHRFLPALFKMQGYHIREIPVRHRARTTGKTKYSLRNRFVKPILDMFGVAWLRRRQLSYQIERELP